MLRFFRLPGSRPDAMQVRRPAGVSPPTLYELMKARRPDRIVPPDWTQTPTPPVGKRLPPVVNRLPDVT